METNAIVKFQPKRNQIYAWDALQLAQHTPSESVNCIVTSPPYYGLRDYGIEGQTGLEDTPEQYVAGLVKLFRELRRVLRNDGVAWLNLGDSYNSAAQFNDDRRAYNERKGDGWPGHRALIKGLKPKDLIGIPWMVAFALRADGWYLRSDIIWSKPNPMPESVTDRPTKAHEYIFLLAKSGTTQYWVHEHGKGTRYQPVPDYRWKDMVTGGDISVEPEGWRESKMPDGKPRFIRRNLWTGRDYWYDVDAIREPVAESTPARQLRGVSEGNKYANGAPGSTAHTMSQPRPNIRLSGGNFSSAYADAQPNHGGESERIPYAFRNRRTVWEVTTKPFHGAHFATFPEDLIEPMILAGCPKTCCAKCGAPYERVVEKETNWQERKAAGAWAGNVGVSTTYQNGVHGKGVSHDLGGTKIVDKGFTPTCTCNASTRAGLVYDPFMGAGTTGLVAQRLGRDYLGSELNAEYAEMARARIDGRMNEYLAMKAGKPYMESLFETA